MKNKKHNEEVVHDFRDTHELDPRNVKAHDISPIEPQKRLRVWENQIDDVIESLKPSNFLTELYRFMRGCDHLSSSFPNHQEMGNVDSIRIEFWARYQEKFKKEILPLIKKWKREEVMKDLRRMGFL